MEKAELIEKSLRCLHYGWLSFIPVFGIVAGLIGIRLFCKVLFGSTEQWNPAKLHLICGAALSLSTLLAHSILTTLFLFH